MDALTPARLAHEQVLKFVPTNDYTRAKRSWWIGLSREEFHQVQLAELPRMRLSYIAHRMVRFPDHFARDDDAL